jgi:hypothetical protein
MKVKQQFFCKRCRAEVTKKEKEEAEQKKRILLCSICKPIIEEKLKKWTPIFQKFKF